MKPKFKVELPNFNKIIYDVTKYGADNKGVMNSKEAIQDAIDSASVTGGYVYFPSGLYVTGPIELKSNVCLKLNNGTVISFSKSASDYPVIESDYEGEKRYRTISPISAKNASNIGIIGGGIINGNGHLWCPVKKFKVTDKEWAKLLEASEYTHQTKETQIWFPTKSVYEGTMMGEKNIPKDKFEYFYDFFRPQMINFVNCNHILLKDVTCENSPAWNIHPLYCTHLTLDNVHVKNPYCAQNGDGIDVESCTYVEIKNSTFEVGDDGICLKSGKGKEARKIKKPSEYIYIHDSIVNHAHGGVVIGSEMSRGINNVYVENMIFSNTDIGIRFKSTLGRGGVVSDIYFNNIVMNDIVNEAMIFTMSYTLYTTSLTVEGATENPEAEDYPIFKDIHINNLVCNNSKIGLKVDGINSSSITDLYLSNSYIGTKKAFDLKNYSRIHLDNVNFDAEVLQYFAKEVL